MNFQKSDYYIEISGLIQFTKYLKLEFKLFEGINSRSLKLAL